MIDQSLDTSCSSLSTSASESILGTAPHIKSWLLIEYPSSFGSDAWEEANIPQRVRDHIDDLLSSVQHSKILLIRSKESLKVQKKQVFWIRHDAETQDYAAFRRHIEDYTDLLSLPSFEDPALIASEFDPHDRKLVLVCTNGRRDPCCAKLAYPIYNLLIARATVDVFECSHLGQHRFAPNLLSLPDGVLYGRVSAADSQDLCLAIENGRLFTKLLRGRSSFPAPAQAAEYFLASRSLVQTPEAIRLLSLTETAADHWRVEMSSSGTRYSIGIVRVQSDSLLQSSCNSEKKHAPTEFLLEGIQAV